MFSRSVAVFLLALLVGVFGKLNFECLSGIEKFADINMDIMRPDFQSRCVQMGGRVVIVSSSGLPGVNQCIATGCSNEDFKSILEFGGETDVEVVDPVSETPASKLQRIYRAVAQMRA